jgi:hypothetical protein
MRGCIINAGPPDEIPTVIDSHQAVRFGRLEDLTQPLQSGNKNTFLWRLKKDFTQALVLVSRSRALLTPAGLFSRSTQGISSSFRFAVPPPSIHSFLTG